MGGMATPGPSAGAGGLRLARMQHAGGTAVTAPAVARAVGGGRGRRAAAAALGSSAAAAAVELPYHPSARKCDLGTVLRICALVWVFFTAFIVFSVDHTRLGSAARGGTQTHMAAALRADVAAAAAHPVHIGGSGGDDGAGGQEQLHGALRSLGGGSRGGGGFAAGQHTLVTGTPPGLPSLPPVLLPSHAPTLTTAGGSRLTPPATRPGGQPRTPARVSRSTAYTFYEPQVSSQGASYTCRRLGAVTHGGMPSRAADGSIVYGPWSMKWPRFVRASHLLWWRFYDVVAWRAPTTCGNTLHPWAAMPDAMLRKTLDARAASEAFPEVPPHDGTYGWCEPEETTGTVSVLLDATVAEPRGLQGMPPVCDHTSRVETLIAAGSAAVAAAAPDAPPPRRLPVAVWLNVEASHFYQHWTQNIAPRLAQAAEVYPQLLDPAAAVDLEGLMGLGLEGTAREGGGGGGATRRQLTRVTAVQHLELTRVPIVRSLYDHIGWDAVDPGTQAVQADQLVYTCASPPLHPYLWQAAQQKVFGVGPRPLEHRFRIVYAGRSRTGVTENSGRRVRNDDLLLALLRRWSTAYEVVEFDHREFATIDALVDFWSDARLLIGPHGGALTAVNFMPCNSAVVELMPLVNGVRPPSPHAAMMMMMQSTFLEMEYWLLPAHTESTLGDFDVPLDLLCEILMLVLGAPDGVDTPSAAACGPFLRDILRDALGGMQKPPHMLSG